MRRALLLKSLCSAEVFVPGPSFCRRLCSSHSIPVCWADSWRAPPEALPSYYYVLNSNDKIQAVSISVVSNQLYKKNGGKKSAMNKWSLGGKNHVNASVVSESLLFLIK